MGRTAATSRAPERAPDRTKLLSRRPIDVSACIVSWNAGPELSRCLGALEEAAWGLVLETIVVDNGSSDETESVLDDHPWARGVVNNRNRGLTAGRNQALDLARGTHVMMLDADTVPQPGSIRRLVDYLTHNPDVGVVGPKLLNPDGSLQFSCRRVPTASMPIVRRKPISRFVDSSPMMDRHLMHDFDHSDARPVDWVLGAAQCYRMSLLETLGGYDERIFFNGGEDRDWCLRVWKSGKEVHYCPEAVMVHVYGHFSRRHPFSKQSLRAFTDYYYNYWKHFDVRHGVAPE